MNRNLIKRIPGIVVIILCSFGVLEQISNVSQRYFQFRTKTIVEMTIIQLAKYPSVSICFRYHDLLDREEFNNKYQSIKIKKWNDPGFDYQEFYEQTKNVTISEMFKLTPSEKRIFARKDGCKIRHPNQFKMYHPNKFECQKSFGVKKYLIKQNICYLVTPKIFDGNLRMYEYTLAPSNPGQMYKITFDHDLFNNIDSVSVSIHSNGSSLIYDSSFASNVQFQVETLPVIDIYNREFVRINLPYPYDTRCSKPSNGYTTWYEYYLGKIDNETMANYNYSIPFAPTFDSNLNVPKIMNSRAFGNQTLTEQLSKLMARLFKRKKSCINNYFVTTSQTIFNNKSAFIVHWTHDEKIILRYSPEQELIDFIVYICSSIGIWFGLSAYSLSNSIAGWLVAQHAPPDSAMSPDPISIKVQEVKRRMRVDNFKFERKFKFVCEKLELVQKFNEQLIDIIRAK